jgi:catechol 2,3-dioxygenase-like lactoylglutathione lyase family enzyme
MARLSRVAPEVPVADLNGALKFYEQKLGFRVVAELPNGDYAIVERDGVAIHLFRDDTRKLSPVGLHIFTHELDELRQELLLRGVSLSQEIIRKPWGNRDFRVNDDWGNQIKFTEPLSEES